MKRIVCIIALAALAVGLLAACQTETEPVTVHTVRGESEDVGKGELKNVTCTGSFDGADTFTLTGSDAWRLFDYLNDIRESAEEANSVEDSEHQIYMLFRAERSGESVDLGVYQAYDSGYIGWLESTYSSRIYPYPCGENTFGEITDMIKSAARGRG